MSLALARMNSFVADLHLYMQPNGSKSLRLFVGEMRKYVIKT